MEFYISANNKNAYVFKIEQIDKDNKDIDIRLASLDLSKFLFNLILKNQFDFFFFFQEIRAPKRYKIFFYLCCSQETKDELIKSNIFKFYKISEVIFISFFSSNVMKKSDIVF